jgi:hypothetical protein
MEQQDFRGLPPALRAALTPFVATAAPLALRRLAVWATDQVPAAQHWSPYVHVARAAALGAVPAADLDALHQQGRGAALGATICGLAKGVAAAAAQMACYGAAHPEPAAAATRAVRLAYRWHELDADGAPGAFEARALREIARSG